MIINNNMCHICKIENKIAFFSMRCFFCVFCCCCFCVDSKMKASLEINSFSWCNQGFTEYYTGVKFCKSLITPRYLIILPRSERHITLPFAQVICLSDLGNILAYYLDKTTLLYNYWALIIT